MTPREADKAIKSGKPVKVSHLYDGTFEITIVSRDRRYIEGTYQENGETFSGKFERADLTIVKEETA